MKIIKFKSSTPAGDLLSMLAGIKHLCNELDTKAIIYQRLGMVGVGYQGATHPFKNENGDEVCMNEYMFNVLKPLLIKLDYIEDFIIYTGQEYDYDLDKGRMEIFTNMPLGSINRWIFHVFPQMSCDLSQKWIVLNNKGKHKSGKICLNFTLRYRNSLVDYHFLKKYEDKIYFIGMQNEYDFFCKQWGLNIEYRKTENYFDVYNCIKESLFFIGNQSSCFQVAEGMKHPRILELCQMMPNVIPVGANAHDFYHQQELEYYVEKMLNLIYICE